MKTRIAAIGLSVLLASTAFAGPASTTAIPDSAKWVVHVDVAAVTASDIANGLLGLIAGKDSPVPADRVAKALQGWKFISTIHSVTLYGPGPVETDAVAVVSAKYDEAQVMAMLKIDARAETMAHGDHTIYPFTGKSKGNVPRKQYGCFYDNTTMVAGASLAQVKAALDVLDGKAKALARNNPLTGMLAPGKGSFMVVAAVDVNEMVAQAVKDRKELARNPGTAMVAKCQDLRFEFGEADDQVYVTGNASMLDEEDAKAIETMLSGFLVMATFRAADDKDATKLLQAIRIDRKGRNVGVAVQCPVETILNKVSGLLAAKLVEVKVEMNRVEPSK